MDNHAYQSDGITGNFRTLPEHGNELPFTISNHSQRNANNDYLVEINSRSKFFRRPEFYKRLSICCFLLSVIFFIAMIVFINLYSLKKHQVCVSNECLRSASNYLYSMNLSVDPCENFYEFACGKWSAEHPNHGWWSSFSSFTSISEKIAISSMAVLSAENSGDEPEALHKSRDFYKACIDKEIQQELGVTAMYPILNKIDLPIVPTIMNDIDPTEFKFNWLQSDVLAKKFLLMDIFIGATVGPNIFNGSENVLYLGQIYQTSPLPSPFKNKFHPVRNGIVRPNTDKNEDDVVRSVNSKIIKYIINIIVSNTTGDIAKDDLLEKASNIIIDMSTDIDEIVANTTNPNADEEDAYPITVDDLQMKILSEVNTIEKDFLVTYLNYLFNETNVTINTKTDFLYVTEDDVLFLKMITDYLSQTPSINIELYVWWATVYAMIINTSEDIVDFISKELSALSNDNDNVVRSRALECALVTNNYMGYAVSYALADKTFPDITKPKVERMVGGIKQAFVNHVNQISWMDTQTKKATLEKSKEMISFIGYPDWLFQDGELDKYFQEVTISSTLYLENMVNVITWHFQKTLNSLRQPHKRDWYSEPIEVNAFNSFSDNAINVPIAILNFPMYHLGLEVLNYGSIGSILGHELTHGFDNIGRKHDKYGNYVKWWTNQTIEAFVNFTDCFVKQYDNYTLPGVEGHINGQRTLGENLADNGGLHQSFQAYRDYVDTNEEEPKLPGFENYTHNQLFFIAYANVWCESVTDKQLSRELRLDLHSPNRLRVTANLQNSEAFSKTFQCPIGSAMNPENKCKLW